MRVTNVILHPVSSATELCVLSFRDPNRANSYNVKTIVGLDADQIVPKYYGSSAGRFYNLGVAKRDIVMRIQLNPNFGIGQTYSGLRDTLYKMISATRSGKVELQFRDDTTVVAVVSGWVTKFEAAHFSDEPEVQITMNCTDPMLKAPAQVEIDVSALDPTLTIVEDDLSTAPHGFRFDIEFTSAMDSLIITDPTDLTWLFDVSPIGGFLVDDVLSFSSENNAKHLRLTRASVTTNFADAIVPGSVWPILFPGENQFACATPTGLNWLSMTHYPTYWGV